ncbi:MAG: AraC family transcriptional regulator [Rikenellaceae bacterium]|jgi:AraC-like DNA-binding protein|nr:AraC family transcriptional regulator [Rikenellaceae bacterium]
MKAIRPVAETPTRNNFSGNFRFWKILYLKEGERYTLKEGDQAALVYIIKGTATVETERSEKYRGDGGEFFLVPPASVCIIGAWSDVHIIICLFEAEHLLSVRSSICNLAVPRDAPLPQLRTFKTDRLVGLSLKMTGRFISEGLDSEDFLDMRRRELLTLLLYAYPVQELSAILYPVIGEDIHFRRLVLTNHATVRTVGELAALANYSVSGFIKKFKRCFGQSPYKWMSARKAELILREICSGQNSLKAIAIKYDFSSYQHFASFCKAHYGAPPTEVADKKTTKGINMCKYGK